MDEPSSSPSSNPLSAWGGRGGGRPPPQLTEEAKGTSAMSMNSVMNTSTVNTNMVSDSVVAATPTASFEQAITHGGGSTVSTNTPSGAVTTPARDSAAGQSRPGRVDRSPPRRRPPLPDHARSGKGYRRDRAPVRAEQGTCPKQEGPDARQHECHCHPTPSRGPRRTVLRCGST